MYDDSPHEEIQKVSKTDGFLELPDEVEQQALDSDNEATLGLPKEIIPNIMKFLPFSEIKNSRLINKAIQEAIDQYLTQPHCLRPIGFVKNKFGPINIENEYKYDAIIRSIRAYYKALETRIVINVEPEIAAWFISSRDYLLLGGYFFWLVCQFSIMAASGFYPQIFDTLYNIFFAPFKLFCDGPVASEGIHCTLPDIPMFFIAMLYTIVSPLLLTAISYGLTIAALICSRDLISSYRKEKAFSLEKQLLYSMFPPAKNVRSQASDYIKIRFGSLPPKETNNKITHHTNNEAVVLIDQDTPSIQNYGTLVI